MCESGYECVCVCVRLCVCVVEREREFLREKVCELEREFVSGKRVCGRE